GLHAPVRALDARRPPRVLRGASAGRRRPGAPSLREPGAGAGALGRLPAARPERDLVASLDAGGAGELAESARRVEPGGVMTPLLHGQPAPADTSDAMSAPEPQAGRPATGVSAVVLTFNESRNLD